MRSPTGASLLLTLLCGVVLLGFALAPSRRAESVDFSQIASKSRPPHDDAFESAEQLIQEGRQTFRYDTFGDEDFWGGVLGLNEAIAGSRFGGVGDGLSPRAALGLGLKVDSDALPPSTLAALRNGRVNLDDPAVTLELLRQNAVVGLTGFFEGPHLKSVGIQCALCHSTVNDAVAPGVGQRLDGWANRDLNVGAIVLLAPHLQPVADFLGTDVATVQDVLSHWGPGKFDAELFLDGKGFRPDGKTAAVLIPPAFGLAGVNLHTWTGWGSVTYWNAFVANLEMHGKGTFFDPRLDNAAQFPVAARNHSGHVTNADDRITPKLPALHVYQLALRAPAPPAGSLDEAAVERGDELFTGKAKCASCHTDELYSEPGWNMHTGEEVGVDNFQADRAPDHRYRTSPLKGLWTHAKGGFFHDGRLATLGDVVDHYDRLFGLGLTPEEKSDLVEYMKSLGDVPFSGPVPAGALVDSTSTRASLPLRILGAHRGLTEVGPNPTRGSAHISFALESPGPVHLGVYDVRGRQIADLSGDHVFTAGAQTVSWDGRQSGGPDVPPGMYFVRLRTSQGEWNQALIRLR